MNTYLPTLKQLQYLVALQDQGHFGRAADACFVTQSTLSSGLRELESLIGASTDTSHVHFAWRKSDEDLANADFPWIADNSKKLADALGIVHPDEGVAYRATFIVDPDNVIQHVTVNGLNVGRNPQETLRVLDALQTDELCPCNWNEGEDVLKPLAA